MGNNSSKEDKHRSKSLKKTKKSSDPRRIVSAGSLPTSSKSSSSGPSTTNSQNATQQQADSRPSYHRSDTLGSLKSLRSVSSKLSTVDETFPSANPENVSSNGYAHQNSNLINGTSTSNINNNSNDTATAKQTQDNEYAFSTPLAPGPSILAVGSTLSGGVSTQDILDIPGDRPRLHRRTYSSNSIINGGVVNISAHNSSTSLAALGASNSSNDNNNNTNDSSNIDITLSTDIDANAGNLSASNMTQSTPGPDINAETDSHGSGTVSSTTIPCSDPKIRNDTLHDETPIPKDSNNQPNLESAATSTTYINEPTNQSSTSNLTIPIPPNEFGASSPQLAVSTPGSIIQAPIKTPDLDTTNQLSNGAATPRSIKKSTSSSSMVANKSSDGAAANSPLTPNGTSFNSFLGGTASSPSSQFVTPLSSPLPKDIPLNESRRKIHLRTPSFGGSSNGTQGNGITLNIDEAIQRLLDAGYRGRTTKHVCLKNNEIALICQTVRDIFLSQPVVLDLSPPVKVVGDVHGQYGDLIRLFDMCGFPPASNYLFLGDYVDRGKQSLETILLLFCYKIKYPENFFLLRGNHECASVTRVYGFYDECKRRTNIKTWKIFIDTFNTLPVASIIAQKIFCVHGGLSPSLTNMDQLRSIQRPTDVPDLGLLNDILWSDPADTENEWEDNERGVSFCFNKVAINKFLAKFGFDLVCRAHIVVEDGYEFFNERTLVTVFSAPNYCGEFDNWGAVMSVSEDLLCSFELLKPLDSMALRQEMQKSRRERKHNAMATLPNSAGAQSF